MIFRAQFVRFHRDHNPMAPGAGHTPISKAFLLKTDEDGKPLPVQQQPNGGAMGHRDELMDEILVIDAWVYLRNKHGARYVSAAHTLDVEPAKDEPAPQRSTRKDQPK